MTGYTSFVDMSRDEARAFLARFLEEMPQRLEWLDAEAAGSVELDFSVDSLGALWDWAAPRFSWRRGYAPPPLGMPGPQIDPAELEPAEELPSWFHHTSSAGYAELSSESLWLLDALGRYLGETVIRNNSGTAWKAAHSRRAGYMFQNQPVIDGLDDDFNPVHACAGLARRALQPTPAGGPKTLLDLYDVRVGPVSR